MFFSNLGYIRIHNIIAADVNYIRPTLFCQSLGLHNIILTI